MASAPNIDAIVFYQLKVTIKGIRPPVWRRLKVPADIPLDSLHAVLQVAFDWQDCHLHDFSVGKRRFSSLNEDYESEGQDEHDFTVSEVAGKGDKLMYTYDFGDGWEHAIVVEKVLTETADDQQLVRCLAGKRAGPLEDSGGPWGYMEKLEVMAGPDNDDRQELAEWMGEGHDPEHFDIDELNECFAHFVDEERGDSDEQEHDPGYDVDDFEGENGPFEYCYDAKTQPNAEWIDLDEDQQHWHVAAYHYGSDEPHPAIENQTLHWVLHTVIETQLVHDDPRGVRAALKRLRKQGLSRHETIHALASVFAEHVHQVSQGQVADNVAYAKQIRKLNAEQWRARHS